MVVTVSAIFSDEAVFCETQPISEAVRREIDKLRSEIIPSHEIWIEFDRMKTLSHTVRRTNNVTGQAPLPANIAEIQKVIIPSHEIWLRYDKLKSETTSTGWEEQIRKEAERAAQERQAAVEKRTVEKERQRLAAEEERKRRETEEKAAAEKAERERKEAEIQAIARVERERKEAIAKAAAERAEAERIAKIPVDVKKAIKESGFDGSMGMGGLNYYFYCMYSPLTCLFSTVCVFIFIEFCNIREVHFLQLMSNPTLFFVSFLNSLPI